MASFIQRIFILLADGSEYKISKKVQYYTLYALYLG